MVQKPAAFLQKQAERRRAAAPRQGRRFFKRKKTTKIVSVLDRPPPFGGMIGATKQKE